MPKIDNYLAFVKEQVAVQHRLARRFEQVPTKKNRHLEASRNFGELAEFLEEIHSKGTQDTSYLNRGNSARKKLLLTYEQIEGIPEELLKELNLTEATDRQDLLIEYLIAKAGGILSLDQVMIDLWKKTSEVPKRNTLTSRLYRMVSKGMIYTVPGKKGVYSTYEMTPEEAKRLFGVDGETDDATAENQPASSAAAPTAAPEATTSKGLSIPAKPQGLRNSKYVSSASSAALDRRF
jgi:hypothetical protein